VDTCISAVEHLRPLRGGAQACWKRPMEIGTSPNFNPPTHPGSCQWNAGDTVGVGSRLTHATGSRDLTRWSNTQKTCESSSPVKRFRAGVESNWDRSTWAPPEWHWTICQHHC